MKLSGKIANGSLSKWLNFGGDPDHRLDTGIVSRVCHYWDGHSFILVRQMATLVRRALAEVCTVPVLVVGVAVVVVVVRKTLNSSTLLGSDVNLRAVGGYYQCSSSIDVCGRDIGCVLFRRAGLMR